MFKLMKETNPVFSLYVNYEDTTAVQRARSLAVLSQSVTKDLKNKLATRLDDIFTMAMKLPSSSAVSQVQKLFNSKHANISFRKDNNKNPDRVSRINSHITYLHNGKVGYISADANSISLSYDLDSTFDIQKAVYEYYHGLIRAGIVIATPSDLNKLADPVINYYIKLIKKNANLSSMNEKQEQLYNFIIAHCVLTTLFKRNISTATNYSLKYINKEYQDDAIAMADNNKPVIENVKQMKDVFSVLNAFGIVYEKSSTYITNMYRSLGVVDYLSTMSSPLDFVCAAVIMSKYDKEYYTLSDTQLTGKIESVCLSLISKIKYGSV